MLVPPPLGLACYTKLSLESGWGYFIDVVTHSQFTVLAFMSFVHAAIERFLNAFKCDSRDETHVLYLVAMSYFFVFLAETVGVCAILCICDYDMVTALTAWKSMRPVDWMAVTPDPVAQLLFFSMGPGPASFLATEGATRLVQDQKISYLTQPLLPAVPYLRTPPSLASVPRTVAEYLHRSYRQPLHSCFLSEPVLEQGSHVSPDLSRNSSAVPASTGSPASEHDDVKRVPAIEALVVSSSLLAGSTISLYEGPTGPISSVRLASFSPGPNTLAITSSQAEVSSWLVASPPKVLFILASSVSLAT